MSEHVKEIAETIFQQFGGGRAMSMIGGKNLTYGEAEFGGFTQPYLLFTFKMCRAYNTCRIILDQGKDLYIMQFFKKDGSNMKEIEDVYAEDLQHIFEQTTKLYLSL